MIKPTIGRVVWFWPHENDELFKGKYGEQHSQPMPGIVCYVWSDTCVNLTVFDPNGNPHGRTSVLLHNEEMPIPSSGFAEWMPYQKGQAAKTEALEKAAAAA